MIHFARAALVAAVLAGIGATPVYAGKPKSVGELISECMQEVEKSRTAGRKLSAQQRMVAETQCRARAESEAAARNG